MDSSRLAPKVQTEEDALDDQEDDGKIVFQKVEVK
jgi:hypothetical protein